VVYLNLAVKSTTGKDLYSSEAWYTLNSIPVAKPVVPRILVYSRTTGFRHDSIPDGIAAIRKLGQENGYAVDASEDSAVFTKANLAKYKAVVFLCTTGDAVAAPNRPALEAFIRGGGGWLGIHSASDTLYDWPFYGDLVGAYFESHPPVQEAEIKIEDRTHFTTWFLPPVWRRTDEWYNFRTNPRQKLHVLASLDESSYQGGSMKGDHPVMWCHEVGKGRAWYTELGHPKEAYSEPLYLATLNRGIQWVLGAR
jgi:type 1 glutamine amidotransferase